jgi:gliding motility-associated-like protein
MKMTAPFHLKRQVAQTLLWAAAFLAGAFITGSTAQAQVPQDSAGYRNWKNAQVGASAPYVARQGQRQPGTLRGGGSTSCDCWVDPDFTYTTIPPTLWNASGFNNTDDGSFGPIVLPFQFYLYGQFYNTVYININGNVSFGTFYGTFSSTGFPFNGFTMVAPFWADVDLGGTCPTCPTPYNSVRYKVTPTAMYVNWTNVGYFPSQTDKLNTFQLIITDGTDPVVNGANVSFCYKDMQWTTGSASGGTNGFGGTAACVGANEGNGIDFIQFGRFDQPGTAYDGPFGLNDGVDWLDQQSFTFSTDITTANVPPVITGQSACDSLILCVGQSSQLQVTFIAPEPVQTTVASASSATLTGYTVTTTSGISADVLVDVTPVLSDTGFHLITFTGTDNGSPILTSTLNVVVQVLAVTPFQDTVLTVCGDAGPTDLYPAISTLAVAGGSWEDPNGLPHSGIFLPGVDVDGPYRYFENQTTACPTFGDLYVTTNILNNVFVMDSTACAGSNDGSLTVTTTGNAGPWNYDWTDALGTVLQNTSGATLDQLIAGAGTYTVVITEDVNGIGCDDTLTAVIQEPAQVTITLSMDDTTICKTGVGDLSAVATGGTGTIDLLWSPGLAGSGPHAVSPLITTTYSVYATDANGCLSDTLNVTVSVLPNIAFTMPDTVDVCPEVDLLLSAVPVSGGDGLYQYDWQGNGPGPSANFTVNLTASELVCVTVNDGCETPSVTRCTFVNVIPIPELVLTADSTLGCEPFAVAFNVLDTTSGASVEWDFGDGVSASGIADIGHTYADPGGYDVSVLVTWPNGCQDDTTISNMIIVEPLADADFTWSPNPGSILTPTLTFTENAGPYATQYIWTFAGLGTATGPVAEFTFPDQLGFTYPVELWVTNYLGCADSLVKLVEVKDEFLIYVPNSFTPDGDGINDVFAVLGNDIDPAEFELFIFNRWGELVFTTNDPSQVWTGAMGGGDGEAVRDGVYPWRLRVASRYSQERRELFGHVTLIK